MLKHRIEHQGAFFSAAPVNWVSVATHQTQVQVPARSLCLFTPVNNSAINTSYKQVVCDHCTFYQDLNHWAIWVSLSEPHMVVELHGACGYLLVPATAFYIYVPYMLANMYAPSSDETLSPLFYPQVLA